MQIRHLSLTNFRNFIRLEVDLTPGPTLLMGANAQGKTSLLEALYYLTGASSPHSTSDRQLINFLALDDPTPVSRIVAEVHRGDRLHRLEIRLVLDEGRGSNDGRLRKEILINGVKRRVVDLASAFNAVLFLPQDVAIVEGSPGARRRFLDAVISQADPLYSQALTEYGKALSQRNALLKQIQERGTARDQLEIWEQQLAQHGGVLLRGRALALRELEDLARPIHETLTQGREQLRLTYAPSFDPLSQGDGQLDLGLEAPVDRTTIGEEKMRKALLEGFRKARGRDIERGVTRVGPHRDDIRFEATGVDLQLYGSRGQNRTAMLATKIAEVEWLKARTGEWPVLLLDEVLAELDSQRRDELLNRVLQVNQAVLTAADQEMFSEAFRERATLWRIDQGNLSPYDG